MSEFSLNDVNLVLVDHRTQLRNSLRMALNEAGLQYKNIIDGAEVGTIAQSIQGSMGPDILICDTDVRGGDLFKLATAIRHNEIGQNPFLAILALSWDPTERQVRHAANSGADFLIAAPFSPKQILDRIRSLVYNRAPFVVTSDYVGPDRRDGADRDDPASLLEVPNSLRDKAMGQFDARAFRSQVESAIGAVSTLKMERHAYRLAEDAEMTAQDFARDPYSIDPACLQRLQVSTTDLRWRANREAMLSIVELCDALHNVIRSVRRGTTTSIGKDIELLKQLAFAIRRTIDPTEEASSIAYDIADAISSRA